MGLTSSPDDTTLFYEERKPAMPVRPENFYPGLVLHLAPAVMLESPLTDVSNGRESGVRHSHFFIHLGRSSDGRGIWVPAYTSAGPGRIQVPTSEKNGHPKWAAGTTYCHKTQYWQVSDEVVDRAQVYDLSSDACPNTVSEFQVRELLTLFRLLAPSHEKNQSTGAPL